MSNILCLVLSNLIVAGGITLIAMAIKSRTHYQSLAHALFVIALIKLVTPPIYSLPIAALPELAVAKTTTTSESLLAADRLESSPDSNHRYTDIGPHPKSGQTELNPTRLKSEASAKQSDAVPYAESANLFAGATKLVRPFRLIDSLIVVWLMGSTVWLWRVFASGRQVHRLIALVAASKHSDIKLEQSVNRMAQRMGLRRPPKLAVVNGNTVPMIWASWTETTLVLPRPLLKKLNQNQIHTLIAHELAHVWCSHHWVRRLEIVVMAVYWWCPLIWLVRKCLHETEEEICDAWVTHFMPDSSADYAGALIDTLNFVNSKSAALPIAASGISQFQLLQRRITMIMKLNHNPGLSLAGWFIIAMILALGIPFSAKPIHGNERPNSSNVPTENDEEREEDEGENFWIEQDGHDVRDENEWLDEQDEEELVEELVEELTEELVEMNSEIEEEIVDIREDLAEAFSELPAFVQRALTRVDVGRIVQKSLREAPKSVRMFIREVDPAGLIQDLANEKNWESDDSDPEKAVQVESQIRAKLNAGITDLVNRVQSQMKRAQTEVRQEIAGLPLTVKQELVKQNVVGIMEEILDESSPIMQQFFEDAEIKRHLTEALNSQKRKRVRIANSSNRIVRQRQTERRQNQWREENPDDHRDKLERKIEILAEELDRLRTELRTIDESNRNSRR